MNNKAYVVSLLNGRLGNILFQLAAGYCYARKLNTDFYIHIKYPHLTPFNEYKFLQNKFKFYNEQQNSYKTYIIQEKQDQTFIDFPIIENTNFILDGYFQSYKYFDKDIIQELFKCPLQYQQYILNKYGNLSQYVGMSVRRGDYLQLQHVFTVPNKNYYIDIYNTYFNNRNIIITSDDIDWCKENINIKNAVYLQKDESPQICLYILSKCKDHIMSSSTYGWWGSFLAEQKNAINICPSIFVKKSNNKFLIPDNWKKIDII